MKKNTMMRLASFLLIAVLISTSAISGTYAKYVTEGSASDTARVAKWGVTVMVSGELFGTDYSAHVADGTGDKIVAATSTSVSALDSDNVVAPGTKNEEGFTISIDGQPEVATTITAVENTAAKEIKLAKNTYGVMVKATGLNADTDVTQYYTKGTDGVFTAATGSWSTGDYYELHDLVEVEADYYPLTWTVTNSGANTDFSSITAARLDGIQDAMVTALNKSYNAEADLTGRYNLTWKWEFENTQTYANGADTILGNLQAVADSDFEGTVVKLDGTSYEPVETTDYELGIDFGFEITVTQVN